MSATPDGSLNAARVIFTPHPVTGQVTDETIREPESVQLDGLWLHVVRDEVGGTTRMRSYPASSVDAVIWGGTPVLCPPCHGEGRIQIQGVNVNPFSGVRGPDPQQDDDVRCPDCDGTGEG